MRAETFHIDGHRVCAIIDGDGIRFDDLPDGLDEGDAREAVRHLLREEQRVDRGEREYDRQKAREEMEW